MNDHIELHGPESPLTLVLIHGAGSNRKMWLPEVDELEDRYRMLLIDLPGHGARMSETYRYGASVAAVEAAIEEHTSRQVVLVGLSLGGYVAMGVRHERVRAMVLSGSTIAYTGWGGLSTKLYGYAIAPITPFIRRINEKAFRKALKPEHADELIEHGLSLGSAARALRTVPGLDYRTMLAEFDGPVLLLNGERDESNRNEEQDAAAVAKDATIVMVEDAGHACSVTQPVAFSAAIDRFCMQLRDTRALD